MYKIIGADQKEYGPITADQIRQWIAEGRLNGQSPAQSEGGAEWKSLAQFGEFAEALRSAPTAAAHPALETNIPSFSSADILTHDYEIDIGGCVGKGWALVRGNFGLLFSAILVYFGVEMAIGLFSAIPIIGSLVSLANLFIAGPLLAGVYYLTVRTIRREPATVGDAFAGFRTGFWQLFLGAFIPGLLAGVCLIPAGIVAAITILPSIMHKHPPEVPQILTVVLVALVCLVPIIFLQVNWKFTLPLIIDKGLDFWTAMRTSSRMVRKHWWQVFGVILLIGVINLIPVLVGGVAMASGVGLFIATKNPAALLLCMVGVASFICTLITVPIGISTLMFAYESVFSPSTRQTN